MKRLMTVFLLGIISISCRAKETAPKALEKEEMLDRAWKYYKGNKCDSSLALFDSVVTEIDPSDLEAHLGLGLSNTCLGFYSQAHREFSLIYSPYLTTMTWDLNLYIDPNYRDTIGATTPANPNAQFVSRYTITFTSPSLLIIGGQWRLGKILRENNVFPSDTNDYIYLITEYGDIKIKPKGSFERLITGDDIYGYTDGLAYVDSFIIFAGGKFTLVDTIGPVLFVSSKNVAAARYQDSVYLHSWLKHPDTVWVNMKVTVFKFSRSGFDSIPWLALAADAHTYYVEGINLERAASLSLIAFWTAPSSISGRLGGIRGLSDTTNKKALAAVYSKSNFKRDMYAGTVSMLRVFDPSWPQGWTYRALSKAEIDTSARWMRHEPKVRDLQRKVDNVFFR